MLQILAIPANDKIQPKKYAVGTVKIRGSRKNRLISTPHSPDANFVPFLNLDGYSLVTLINSEANGSLEELPKVAQFESLGGFVHVIPCLDVEIGDDGSPSFDFGEDPTERVIWIVTDSLAAFSVFAAPQSDDDGIEDVTPQDNPDRKDAEDGEDGKDGEETQPLGKLVAVDLLEEGPEIEPEAPKKQANKRAPKKAASE